MTELEAIRERVDAFDELQEMPMSLRFGTQHDLVLARDIIREYDRIATEQVQRIKELTSAGLKAYKALKKAKFHGEATAMYNALQGGQDE